MKTIIISFAFALTTIMASGQLCNPFFTFQGSAGTYNFFGNTDSLNTPGDTVISWTWTFTGGGASYTATGQYPIMQLTDLMTYYVCVDITTQNGCSGTHCDSIFTGLQCPSAGQDFSNCGLEATLNASVNLNDYNTHWIVPAGITAIDINSPTTNIIAASTGTYNLIWQVTNNLGGICNDTISIEFIAAPTSNAGGNYWPGLFGPNSTIKTDTVCGLSYNLNAIPSNGNGTWVALDSANTWFGSTGTSSLSTNPNDTVNTVYYSLFNPTVSNTYYQFVWTENNNSCIDKDTLRLYFAPVPSGQFNIEQPNCPQNNYKLIANTWPLPNNVNYFVTDFDWTYLNGVLDSTIISPTTQDTLLISWPSGGIYNVTLTTTNGWGCSSPLISHQINVPTFANLTEISSNPTIIGGNDGYIETFISGGTPPYMYSWNTGQTTSSIYNLTSGLYFLNVSDANECNSSLLVHLYEPYDTLGGPIVDTLSTGTIDSCLNFVPDSFYISQIDIINNTEVLVTWVFAYQGQTQSLQATYTFGVNGNYMVTLTIDCGSKFLTTFASYIHINQAMGITSLNNNMFDVYPNPASEMFNINAKAPYSFSVTDISGRLIVAGESEMDVTGIHAANLPEGMYIIKVKQGETVGMKKIIITK